MPTFGVSTIEAIKGRQVFLELVINGVGQLQSFENELQDVYKAELRSILTRMNYVADMVSLPKEKFREITPKGERVNEFEFKTKNLRVYCIKIPNGKLVVLCGFKNSQKADISSFRGLKKQYLKTLEQ